MRTGKHAGLLYKTVEGADGKTDLYFLPNFFNTLQESLRKDRFFSTVVSNIAMVLLDMGKEEEAAKAFKEAGEFSLGA